MKSTILLMLTLLTFSACQKSTTTKSTNNTSNNPVSGSYCTQYPQHYGCPEYCLQNPTQCNGSTTGGTTGGNTVNPNPQYPSTIPSDNNWGSFYPKGVPAGSCSSPTGSGYEPRKGTITVAGGTWYSPDNAWSSVGNSEYSSIQYNHNVSSHLVDVNKAKQFIDSDGRLKMRFKVRPQVSTPPHKTWCFNQTPLSPDPYGYTSLRFTVALRGVNADGTLMPNLIGSRQLTVGVNSCSAAIDFSGVNQSYPHGIVFIVTDVYKNSGCWYQQGCTTWVAAKPKDCWSMDVEVSTDGEKDFN